MAKVKKYPAEVIPSGRRINVPRVAIEKSPAIRGKLLPVPILPNQPTTRQLSSNPRDKGQSWDRLQRSVDVGVKEANRSMTAGFAVKKEDMLKKAKVDLPKGTPMPSPGPRPYPIRLPELPGPKPPTDGFIPIIPPRDGIRRSLEKKRKK